MIGLICLKCPQKINIRKYLIIFVICSFAYQILAMEKQEIKLSNSELKLESNNLFNDQNKYFLSEPEIAEYLNLNPEISLDNLEILEIFEKLKKFLILVPEELINKSSTLRNMTQNTNPVFGNTNIIPLNLSSNLINTLIELSEENNSNIIPITNSCLTNSSQGTQDEQLESQTPDLLKIDNPNTQIINIEKPEPLGKLFFRIGLNNIDKLCQFAEYYLDINLPISKHINRENTLNSIYKQSKLLKFLGDRLNIYFTDLISLLGVNGLELTQDAKVLYISSNMISNLEEYLFFGLVNLNELSLLDNKIETVEPNAFASLRNLKRLILSTNKIKRLDPNAFSELINLTELDLSYNSLETIDNKLLANLVNLKKLNLMRNRINRLYKDVSDPKNNAFSSLTNLVELNLSNNPIYEISNTLFSNLGKLEKLNLNWIDIKHLQANNFNGLSNLKELKLVGINIDYIEPNTFLGLDNLIKLVLKGQYESIIIDDIAILNGLPKLKLLKIDQISSKLRPILLEKFPEVERLDIEYSDRLNNNQKPKNNHLNVGTLETISDSYYDYYGCC